MATMPSASHVAGEEAGVIRHVTEVLNPAVAVARPLVPVSVVKVAVAPCKTDFVSGFATGRAGAVTVGVIVALATCDNPSCITYFTGDAVPLKVGYGSNVTVPFAFTVYVPSFGTSRNVRLQFGSAVDVVAHSFTDEASSAESVPAESLASGEMV
jgi:hypothetical protein